MKPMLATSAPVILYIEDDDDDMMIFESAARELKLSYELVQVRSGELALAWLVSSAMAGAAPRLIIADFNLPKMSGLDAIRLIREAKGFEHTPAVIYTTADPEQSGSQFEDCPVEVVQKGKSFSEVRSDAKRMLALMSR